MTMTARRQPKNILTKTNTIKDSVRRIYGPLSLEQVFFRIFGAGGLEP